MLKSINANFSRILDTALVEIAKRRHLTLDKLKWEGIIRIRELPFETEEEYRQWWLPETDEQGKVTRPARMSDREKARYQVEEAHNLITTSGRTQLLTFAGSNTTTAAFSQYFSVGTFPINTVSPGDTNVAGELARYVPSDYTVTGNTVDISTFFGTSQGNGILTNAGLYGGGSATSTLGTGVLYTHALLNAYNKVNTAVVTFDYLVVLQ
jgi:hypothetical protein